MENADSGRVLTQLNDGWGIILNFVLKFVIDNEICIEIGIIEIGISRVIIAIGRIGLATNDRR